MGAIPIDDPVLSSLKIKRSYENPLSGFGITSESAMSKILNDFILKHKVHINNFEDFTRIFVDYYLHSDITETVILSDYMKSVNSNMFQSGLALDIGGLDFSNDAQKEEQMFNSPAFQYYMNITKQYGFRVDQNNPGVIVSDLDSPVTANYRKRYLLVTVSSVFNKQYDKTIFQDLVLLENLLIKTYNNYVDLNPYNTSYKSCNNNTIAYINNIKYRSYIQYNTLVVLYINMKNFFDGSPLSPSSRKQISQTALSIAKHDKEKA